MTKTTKMLLAGAVGLFAYFWWKNRSLHISIPAEGAQPFMPPASDSEVVVDPDYKLHLDPNSVVTTGQEYFQDPGVELAKQIWGYSGVPSLNQLRSIGRH